LEESAKKRIKVFMGIPSTGERLDAQNYFLRRIEKRYEDKIEFVYPDVFVSRIFHDFARNMYVKQFLASDCDVLWFLDADILPPDRLPDLFENFDDWDLAGAPYPVWMTQEGYEEKQITYCVYKTVDGKPGMFPAAVPLNGGIDYVEGIATGCIFIKRHVIEKLEEPYFEFKFNEKTREMTQGEDLGFCMKINKLGFKFFIDYSMVCHHYKKISLLDVDELIQSKVQAAIDQSDSLLRQAIAKKKLEKMAREQAKSKLVTPVKSNLILPNSSS
jgi:hypothetical protein